LRAAWEACTALPAEMDDRDLTEDVRLAGRLLDDLADFGADTGDDGAASAEPEGQPQ